MAREIARNRNSYIPRILHSRRVFPYSYVTCCGVGQAGQQVVVLNLRFGYLNMDGEHQKELDCSSATRAIDATKTSVSLLNELCVTQKLGGPVYELINISGESHERVFEMLLNVSGLRMTGTCFVIDLCISCHDYSLFCLLIIATGVARAKMQAKHRAAENLMLKIVEAVKSGNVEADEKEKLNNCSDLYANY